MNRLLQRLGIFLALIVLNASIGFAQYAIKPAGSVFDTGSVPGKGIEIRMPESSILEKEIAPEEDPYDLFWDHNAEGKLIFFPEVLTARDTVCVEAIGISSEKVELLSFPAEMVQRIREELKTNPFCRVYFYSTSSQEWPNRVSDQEHKNVVQLILWLIVKEGISAEQLTWHTGYSESGYWTMRFPEGFKAVRNRGIPGFALWFEQK